MKPVKFALTLAIALALLKHGNMGQAQTLPYRVYLPIVAQSNRFYAWALTWNSDTSIQIQVIGMDARQDKQFTCSVQEAVTFAALHPGKLYIACDEPGIPAPWKPWSTPAGYAEWYHGFVLAVSAVDPTARFSPAGFNQPGIDYAQEFYNETIRLYGNPPVAAEWRFHAFICNPAGIGRWRQIVKEASEWSAAHGAPMTLGSFGMPCKTPEPDITITMWAMYDAIVSDPNIVSAVWWSADWFDWPHTLRMPDGNLSPEGEVYRQWR